MSGHVYLLGTSHHVAPIEERERLAISEHEQGSVALAMLRRPGITEAVVVSTCNRVELVVAGNDPDVMRRSLCEFVTERIGGGADWIDRYAYVRPELDAVSHLFRVTGSLDSLVVGEPQIQGQVKRAYQACVASGATGPLLHRTFDHALRVAKRIRTETAVAENAVSISYAAVELGKKVFGRLEGKSVLVIGAGKMGGLAVQHLIDAGASDVHLMNRTYERAVEAAARLGGAAHGLDELDAMLAKVDIVISSTGSQHYVVKHDAVRAALARRKYRPLFLIDIAVPRDIDPRCDGLSNVYLFDIDDLRKVVEANMETRRAEAAKAEDIVLRETDEMRRWLAEANVKPTIVGLRRKLTELKDAELERMRRQHPELPPEAFDMAARMAHGLVNKILHEPTISLRASSATDHHLILVAAVRSLFNLNEGDDEAPEPETPT